MRFMDISNLFPLDALHFLSSLPCKADRWVGTHGRELPCGHPTPLPHWQDPFVHPLHCLPFTHLTALKGSGSSGTGAKRVLGFFFLPHSGRVCHHTTLHPACYLSENAFRNCSCRQLRALCDPCPAKHPCSRACEMCPSLCPCAGPLNPPENSAEGICVGEGKK